MALASLRPFRHRDFALVWSASAVSNVGTWIQAVAVGALVTERTGRASWAALVAVAAFLPIGLLAPLGGALADRLDRRRWLAAISVVQAALAGALALLSASGNARPGPVTAVVFLSGCLSAVALPFHQAMIPDLVHRDDILAAASLGNAQYNLGRVVGPALAALLIGLTSFSWAFVANAVSYFAVVVALALIPAGRPPSVHAEETILRGIAEGIRMARREPGCRSAILLISLAAFLAAPFIALVPAKATALAEGGARAVGAATGALTTAQGLGAIGGALVLAPVAARLGRRRLLVFDLVGTALALAAYARTSSLPAAAAALVAVGALYVGVLSGLGTVIQLRAPAPFRGRLLSLFMLALGVIYPIGALVQGALADRVGLTATTTGAALLLVGTVGVVAAVRPALLHALDDPEQPADVTAAPPVRPSGAAPDAMSLGVPHPVRREHPPSE